jgi:hypothetical protein
VESSLSLIAFRIIFLIKAYCHIIGWNEVSGRALRRYLGALCWGIWERSATAFWSFGCSSVTASSQRRSRTTGWCARIESSNWARKQSAHQAVQRRQRPSSGATTLSIPETTPMRRSLDSLNRIWPILRPGTLTPLPMWQTRRGKGRASTIAYKEKTGWDAARLHWCAKKSERVTLVVCEAVLPAPATEVAAVASTMGHREAVLSVAPTTIVAAEDSSNTTMMIETNPVW